MDYFRLFYEYFKEKVSDSLFVKFGSVIIFFWCNLVANFAREYESSHDRLTAHIILSKLFYILIAIYLYLQEQNKNLF